MNQKKKILLLVVLGVFLVGMLMLLVELSPNQTKNEIITPNNSESSAAVEERPAVTVVPIETMAVDEMPFAPVDIVTEPEETVQPTDKPESKPEQPQTPVPPATKPQEEIPTEAPVETPTTAPTEAPVETPTTAPTEAPVETPTTAPTEPPADNTPTEAPNPEPSVGGDSNELPFVPAW